MQDTVQDSVQDTLQTRTNGKRWTLDYPELGTAPLPVTPYLSPEYFTQEREKIFNRTWLCTGKRVEEISQAGDYLVQNVEVAKTSVLLVRGKDGMVRGFHNVCKHRGNRLAWEKGEVGHAPVDPKRRRRPLRLCSVPGRGRGPLGVWP